MRASNLRAHTLRRNGLLITCATCGNEFEWGGEGKRGRPPEYCSKECREFAAALTILKKWAGPVAKRSTAQAWAGNRYELWSMANASPAFQKAMAARSKARKAEIAAAQAAGAIPKRGKQAVTFELVIGGVPVSGETYTTKAAADKAAKAFSLANRGAVVDVRTVQGKERRSRFRDGRPLSLTDEYTRLNRGRR